MLLCDIIIIGLNWPNKVLSTLILDNNKYYAATTNVCDGIETSKNGANIIMLHIALKSEKNSSGEA